MQPQELTVTDEDLARCEEICLEAARKRLSREDCVRIIEKPFLQELNPGDFVIVAAPREVQEPFYVAQVNFV